MFLAPLLLTLQVSAKTITLSQPAVALPVLLKEVSSQVGVTLKCATQLNDDVVCVDLQGVSLADFEKYLATIECASWSQDGATNWINIDTNKQNAVIAANQDKTAKAVQKNLIEQSKIKPDPTTDSQAQAQVQPATEVDQGAGGLDTMFGQSDPALYSALIAIGAKTLINTGPYNRIVFSNQPTAMQYQIPPAAASIIESQLLPKALKGLKASQGQILKYDLVDKGTSYIASMYEFNLTFYSSNGDAVSTFYATSYGNIDFMGDVSDDSTSATPSSSASGGSQPDPTLNNKPKGNPVTIPADVIAAGKVAYPMGNLGATKSSTQESPAETAVKALLKTPSKIDPLTWTSEIVIAAAKASHKNLIAVLPDSTNALMANYNLKKGVTDQQIFDDLGIQFNTNVDSTDPSWIQIRPNDPDQARQNRTSRSFLQNLVDYELANENPSIVPLAQIASHLNSEMDFQSVITQYMTPFRPSWLSNFFMQSFDFLAFYGTLSDDERSMLANSSSLDLSGLTGAAKARAAKMLYSGSSKLSVINSKPKANPNDPFAGLEGVFGGQPNGTGPSKGIQSEPTEACPNGLPGNGTLEGKLTDSEVQQVVPKKTAPKELIQSLDKIGMPSAMIDLFLSMPSDLQAAGDGFSIETMIEGFSTGHRQTLDMRIYVAKGLFMAGTIHNDTFPADAPVVSLADYKKAHQAEIDKQKGIWDKYKKEMESAGDGTKPGP